MLLGLIGHLIKKSIMNEPELFLKNLYQELALGFKRDYEDVVRYIKTFEEIFKEKKWKPETRVLAKEILKDLYTERNKNAAKAKHYRKMYHNPEGCQRIIGWGKSRA